MVKAAAFLLVLTLALSVRLCAGLAPNGLIIPSYFFPTEAQWDTLLSALTAQGVPASRALLILNANNGQIGSVGESDQALWRTLAADRVSGVGQALCYVNLCDKAPPFDSCGDIDLQGARPVAEVLALVDDWIAVLGLSNIAGFFLDDTRMDADNVAIKSNVLAIIDGIKSRRSDFLVVTNPGVAATDTQLVKKVSATIYDEGPFPDSEPAPKTLRKPNGKRFPRRKFAMILHSVPEGDWSTYIETARTEGYYYFYATNGSYSELPPYLDDMLARIAL